MVTKSFYQSRETQKLDWTTISGYARTLKRLQTLINLKMKDIILDVGCGAGHLAIPLLNYGANVIGMDISRYNIRHIKNLGKHLEIVIADAERLPFRNTSFDKVFAFGVLEHLPNPERALNEIRRCLGDEGKLSMLQTYRLDHYQIIWHRLLYKLRLTTNPVSSIEKEHINQFKPEVWRQLITKCGLTLTTVIPTSILPTLPFYYALSIIPPNLKNTYFNLPLLRSVDAWLKAKSAIADKLALAYMYVSVKRESAKDNG